MRLSLKELEAAHAALRDIDRRRRSLIDSRYDARSSLHNRDEEIEAIVAAVDRERGRTRAAA
jgi:hypothetical protein